MPGSWIDRRKTSTGASRFHVKFRTGGRESRIRHAGAFRTLREAQERRRWVDGELAAMRVPDLDAIRHGPERASTLAEVAERWMASRIDVAESTRTVHGVALKRATDVLGNRPVDEITADEVAALIASLAVTHKRGSITKTLTYLRNVIDHAGVEPNPARDRRVRLPREEKGEIEPPEDYQVVAVLGACAPKYRLALVVLDATGMRVGELESLRWGDVDEGRGRWRVSRDRSKTRKPRWVQVPPDVFAAVLALRAREDRDAEGLVFPDVTQERLRTDVARACRATGTPAWSPHDLRHRRISLWHREGVDWANIGEWVGQRRLSTTADTYTHVVMGPEVDYASWL